VKNPEILDKKQNRILSLPDNLRSEKFRTRKDAEKDLSLKVLEYLQSK